MGKFIRLLRFAGVWSVLLVITCWGSAALWFDGPASPLMAGILAVGYALVSLSCVAVIRSRRYAYAAFGIFFSLILSWWLSLEPGNFKDWQQDVAKLPMAMILGEKVTIRNLRNFTYRSETDYDEHWETRSYDLSKIRGLDLFLSYWGSNAISHTILSWEFEDGQYLAVSIETRKRKGQEYSAVRGFFKQYELYYVVADERDVVKLRTNYRHESVYLYRLRTPPARARLILLDYLETINDLIENPKWYNALITNCTTNIRLHANRSIGGIPYGWRWLINGYLDEGLYKEGILNSDLSFAELKSSSYINRKAQEATDRTFSVAIRDNLPPRPRFPRK